MAAPHVIPDRNAGHTLGGALGGNRRILLIVLGGAAAIALLVARRGAAAASTAPAATSPTQDPNAPTGSTFADNGGQASALGNDVTGALGDFSTSMAGLTSAVQGLVDQQGQQPPDATGTATLSDPSAAVSPVTINFAVPASIAAAGGGKTTKGAAAGKPKTIVRPSASHGGRPWVYRVGAGGRAIPVRAAPRNAHITPKGSPSGKHQPVHHHASKPAPKKKKR